LTVRLANDGDEPASVGVRQLVFPGWRAWLDGRPLPLDVAPYVPEQQASPGFIVLHIPPGEHTVSLAFGPTWPRLAGMGLTLGVLALSGLAAAWWAGRSWGPFVGVPMLLAAALLTSGAGYLTWRGLSPLLEPYASLPDPLPSQEAGVWRAPDLADGAGGLNGLVVNLAEAVRQGQASVSSPTGGTLGPHTFVDVRQLTVTDEDDPLRRAPGTAPRQRA